MDEANGESIYGTQASPFAKTPWGRCTQKALDGGKTRLYLHVFDWPSDAKLTAPVKNKVVGAKCLACGSKLETKSSDGAVEISLPKEAPCKIATVIVLDVEGTVSE